MGRLIPDLLRAIADGWDKAAGPDPVDQHAAEAVALLRPDQCHCIWCTEGPDADDDEDPDEVVVTAAVDQDKVIQLGLDLQAARRTIIALRAKLAEKNTDPADTAQVGFHLPLKNHGERCGATTAGDGFDNKWYCSRSPHVSGQHVATVGDEVVAVWPNEHAPNISPTLDALLGFARLIHFQPGDGVVIHVPADVTRQDAEHIRDLFMERFPDNRCAVLAGPAAVERVDRDALARELIRAYCNNETLTGVTPGWLDVADRALAVIGVVGASR
jgi:hypothetical protein